MRIQRLPWAGLKIEVGSTTLFVDAIERASSYIDGAELARQRVPLTANTPDVHALITHAHRDHYDPVALRAVLGEQGNVICHHSVVGAALYKDVRVRGVDLYEPLLLNALSAEVTVTAVPASDGFGEPQISWIIDGAGRRIIHCGDTIWHGHWWNIARSYAPFDLAFLPINGVLYNRGRYTGSRIPATMTPEQATTAGYLLRAKRVCPIHYGLFHDPLHYAEFPNAEATFLEAAHQQGIQTALLQPGTWVSWDDAAE